MSLLTSRTFWLGLAIGALAYGASFELRESFVEPSSAALVCNTTPHPSWCLIRFALLAAQHNALFGVAALLSGILALFRGGRAMAVAAAGLSVAAIANYNVEMGVLALIFGLIASVRTQARPAPHRDAPPV